MKQTLIISILVLLISCKKNPEINNDFDNLIETSEGFTIPNDVKYEIINEVRNEALKKTNIEIRLSKEIDENILENIAILLKSERPEFEKLWIFYYLPGHEVENGAWATTHFSPELEVKVLGASKEASNEMNNIKVTGNIIHIWKDNDPMTPNKIHLVKENKKLYMKSVYAKSSLTNAGQLIFEVTENKQNGITRYDYENNHGEYYLIEKNGNLGHYSDNGKFKEAIKEK